MVVGIDRLTEWADKSPEHRRFAIGYKPNSDRYWTVHIVAGATPGGKTLEGWWSDDDLDIAASLALEGIAAQIEKGDSDE